MLPAFKGGGFVELILIDKSWCSLFHTESIRKFLTYFLKTSGCFFQTKQATLLNHSSARPLQPSESLGITNFVLLFSKAFVYL